MSARDEVLRRIRTALGEDRPEVAVPRGYRTTDDRPPAELLDVLADRLEDYRAAVVRCAPAEVAATVTRSLAGRAPVVVAPGLPRTGGRTARRRTTTGPPWRSRSSRSSRSSQSSPRASPGSPWPSPRPAPWCSTAPRRALSLLPDVLVCVVTADQVLGGVPEALARLDPTAPLTMISGPSATSDIELQRVEGVHGPRTLVVVLVV